MKHLYWSLCMLLCACGSNPSSSDGKVVTGGGGGTDVDNARIWGVVSAADSTPIKNAEIRLIPKDYNPVADANTKPIVRTWTNQLGEYEFNVSELGVYSIEINTIREKGLQFNVSLTSSREVKQVNKVLRKPGVLKIIIPKNLRSMDDLYVYIPGSTYFEFINEHLVINDSVYLLNSVPSQYLTAIKFASRIQTESEFEEKIEQEIPEEDTLEVH